MLRPLLRAAVAGALVSAIAMPCAAQGRIAFVRGTYNADDTLRASTLYRVNADGSGFLQLAPMTAGTYRFDPQWSPSGNTLVYQYRSSATGQDQLWRMSATGSNRTRISFGTASHEWPVWRPDGGMIAFVSHSPTYSSSCLAIVRPDGTGQRNLFCPAGPAYFDGRPRWSSDGTRLFASTSLRGSGLEPPYYSRAFRINAATGAATLLTAQTFEDETRLVIHPSGTHGLYEGSDGILYAVDFATDALVPRTRGFNPVWSAGGTRFAYSKDQVAGSALYTHVWVMSADGSTDTEIPMPVADGLGYYAVEFSRDARRLLTNRWYTDDVAIRLFNAATGSYVSLPRGSASDWYQP